MLISAKTSVFQVYGLWSSWAEAILSLLVFLHLEILSKLLFHFSHSIPIGCSPFAWGTQSQKWQWGWKFLDCIVNPLNLTKFADQNFDHQLIMWTKIFGACPEGVMILPTVMPIINSFVAPRHCWVPVPSWVLQIFCATNRTLENWFKLDVLLDYLGQNVLGDLGLETFKRLFIPGTNFWAA